nr:EamA family transporter RarD [Kistimonas asteriae]
MLFFIGATQKKTIFPKDAVFQATAAPSQPAETRYNGNAVTQTNTRSGLFFAIAAFSFYGFMPVYFKQVEAASAMEVLAHRVFWSFLLLGGVLWLLSYWQGSACKQSLAALRNWKTCRMLLLSSSLIAVNWLTFIWAVGNDRITDASLGYFINPLVNILLGMVFLQERLTRPQWLAVLLALTGVAWQVLTTGNLPIVALILAFTFGFYGLVRKQAALPAVSGLLAETALMLPFCVVWFGYLVSTDSHAFRPDQPSLSLWLAFAGVITTVPLLLFTAAATRIRLSTLGFTQYIGPSLSLCLAIFVYNEPFDNNRLVSFLLIWTALAVFTADSLRRGWRQGA